MRRLPIYFLIDVSESMAGTPVEQVQKGMRDIIQELRSDPYALETAWVSVIAYAGRAETLVPLSELYTFYPPEIPIGSGTSLGAALDYLMADIDRNVVRTTAEQKGDWKPLIFLFTDGTPTDNPAPQIERWAARYGRRTNMVIISIGDNIDPQVFSRLTENIIRLNGTDEMSYKAFFKWISASICSTSQSVSDNAGDDACLADPGRFNLEKVSTSQPRKVDENFAVILGKCQNTGRRYLVKYTRHRSHMREFSNFEGTEFRLTGAYPIDDKAYDRLSLPGKSSASVNSMELIGSPACPCCGNQYGLVQCNCGKVFCVGDMDVNKCPWCGLEGTVGVVEIGFDISRTIG